MTKSILPQIKGLLSLLILVSSFVVKATAVEQVLGDSPITMKVLTRGAADEELANLQRGEKTVVELGASMHALEYLPGEDPLPTDSSLEILVRYHDDDDLSKNTTVHGQHVSFVDFPQAYFNGGEPPMSMEELVRMMDIYFEILREVHPGYSGEHINFAYGGDCGDVQAPPGMGGGAYSEWQNHTITLCNGSRPRYQENRLYPFGTLIHGMSHNMSGTKLAQETIFESYSAYFDEHQAEVIPEYVFQSVKKRAHRLKISQAVVQAMRQSNDLNRKIQKEAHTSYVKQGKPFHILQGDDPTNATVTGQATSHFIFSLSDRLGTQGIKKYGTLIQDKYLQKAFRGATPTPEKLANYVAAAWSVAYGRDLSSHFKNNLGYPIDKATFQTYRKLLRN